MLNPAASLFGYLKVSDSGVTATTRDTLYGQFTGGTSTGDKIDLSAVATGNSASAVFHFNGAAAFTTNHPGQVRVTGSGTTYTVSINTDNEVAAEMTIVSHTSAAHTFVAGDFFL